MDDLRDTNGVVFEDTLLLSPSPSPSSLPRDPFTAGPEPWAAAERSTGEIIAQVQATVASDERRNKVIDYVQRLLRSCTGCEVFPYGSVPLKTYLPDGDIDLTIFGGANVEEALANNVCSVLEAEDHNSSAECIVKDVQYIRAEVKIVKCLVQNIVVDISFNQLGGLCTLCFLEKVDRLIGKDHLFKRSIILIKAWCYYESRILGAHHGLISTYALETLVLYIFHLFHATLDGPLAVLYKFLEYFSKFDWENFCVSLSGPIPLSSTENAVDRPGVGGVDLLLSDEFLKDCVEKFSVPLRGTEASSRIFIQKHLNIVDPLKENNNLGRSVSKGNFFRIRSAFNYGARKLGQILLKPNENIAEEVSKFFENTLDRHGKGLRPDVYDPLPASLSGPNGFVLEMPPFSGTELFGEDRQFYEAGFQLDQSRIPHVQQQNELLEAHISGSGNTTSDCCASISHLSGGTVNGLISSGVDIELANRLRSSALSSASESKSAVDNAPHSPHHPLEYGQKESGYRDSKQESVHGLASINVGVSWEQEQHLKNNHSPPTLSVSTGSDDSQCSSSVTGSSDGPTGKTVSLCNKSKKPLSDLCGDLDNNLDSLHCGRWWFDHAMGANTPLVPQIHPHLQFIPGKNPWESMQYPIQYGRNMFGQMNANNGVIPRPPYLPLSPLIVPGAAFGMEEMPRTRGTGTYFPITNSQSYRNRSYQAKGRGMGPSKSPRTNGRVAPFSERSPHAKSNRDPTHSIQQLPSSSSPKGKALGDVNGLTEAAENGVEFGVHGHLLHPVPLENTGTLPCSGTDPAIERIPVVNGDRLVVQPYRLLEEDFPPLSSS